jgi:hypothetical protein
MSIVFAQDQDEIRNTAERFWRVILSSITAIPVSSTALNTSVIDLSVDLECEHHVQRGVGASSKNVKFKQSVAVCRGEEKSC